MGVGGEKRVKAGLGEKGSISDLRQNVFDLQFIINHLRDDVEISLQQSQKSLRSLIEREIAILVYALREEQICETLRMKDLLESSQIENKILMENEGALMDELARLALENERLKAIESQQLDRLKESPRNARLNEQIVSDLEKLMIDDGFLEKVKAKVIQSSDQICKLEKENESLKGKDLIINELKTLLEVEKENVTQLMNNLVAFENGMLLEIEEKKLLKLRLEDSNLAIEKFEIEIKDMTDQRIENEARIRELMSLNCELMDSFETARLKESDLKVAFENSLNNFTSLKLEIAENICNLKKDFELEKNILREEINMEREALSKEVNLLHLDDKKYEAECESLKMIITAQKIEMEKLRETLNRERKLSSLKISDLQEQINEYKDRENDNKNVDFKENDSNSLQFNNSTKIMMKP